MDIVSLVAVSLIFAMPIAITVAAFIFRYKTSKKRYEAMVKAIELGKDPEEIRRLFEVEKKPKKRNSFSQLKTGIILIGIGFGLIGMGSVMGEMDLYGPGVLMLILGLAFIVIYLIQRPRPIDSSS